MTLSPVKKNLLKDDHFDTTWRDELPKVKGRYIFDYDLSAITWFKVGGPCDVLFKPYDIDDLSYFLKERDKNIIVTLLGAASNVLVRDGGIKGCVIKLGRGFSEIEIDENINTTADEVLVTVGAACLDRTVVMECQARGLTGLEFLVGIPGSIGGAIAMNAGAYGFEVKDFLKTIEIMDAAGNRSILNIEDLFMTYRQGNLPEATIVLKATFLLKKGNPEQIQKLIQENLAKREDTQPIHGRTGGSTFKNPEDPTVKAWQLIDQAGCRGLKQNDAMVSELHCNFLLNTDKAKASDLESLGEAVRTRVEQTTGVVLEWEIIRLGIVQDQRLKSNA